MRQAVCTQSPDRFTVSPLNLHQFTISLVFCFNYHQLPTSSLRRSFQTGPSDYTLLSRILPQRLAWQLSLITLTYIPLIENKYRSSPR